MPPALPALQPRLRLGETERPGLSAALQSFVLSQRSPRAAWLGTIDLHAARAADGITDPVVEVGGTPPSPDGAGTDADWLEGRILQGGRACALLFGDAVLFSGIVTLVTLRLSPDRAPAIRLTCKSTAPSPAQAEAIAPLRHGSGLRQAEFSFATASPTRVQVQATAEGVGLLRPGITVDVAALGSAFGGRYRVGAVSWRWDASGGASTVFEARRVAAPSG